MSRFWHSPWLHFGLWVGLVFGMSSIPDLKPPAPGVPGVDKLFHTGEYAVLGWLWGRARGRAGAGLVRGALLGLGVGVADELYQGYVPGREVDLFDVAADVVGAALGCSVSSRRTRAERRPNLP